METGHALSLQPFIPEWGNGIGSIPKSVYGVFSIILQS